MVRGDLITISRVYLGLLLRLQGPRVTTYFMMSLLLGLLAGVGLLMLVPLLLLVGVDGSGGWVSEVVSAVFNSSGVTPTIEVVVAVFLLVIAGHALLLRWTNLVKSELELRFAKSLRDRMYAAVVSAGWSFYGQRRSSDFTHALTSNLDRVSTATFYFLQLYRGLLLTTVHLALAFALSPAMALISCSCLAVIAAVLRRQNRLAAATGKRVTELSERFYGEIADHLGGMKETKSFGAERRQIDRMRSETAELVTASLQFARVKETTTFVYTVISATLLAAMLLAAVRVLRIQPAELIVLVFVFARLVPRLRDLHLCYQQILNAVPALKSAVDLQAECDDAREQVSPRPAERLPLQHSIELRGVSYRYGDVGAASPALRDIDLTIRSNTTTAIVGPSGSGKSTLADLLLGLVPPTAGEILVDSVSLDADRWRLSTGYVPQTTFLLHDTIRANLLWAQPDASDEELQQALRAAAADTFVEGLPAGLQTIVGDRGSKLSGGEAQRIALARALLRSPSVLVLDEATNSLDPENQQRIQTALRQLHGRLTVIVAAHRIASIRDADQIVVMEGGRIAEVGTFDDLAERCGGRFQAILAAEESAIAGDLA